MKNEADNLSRATWDDIDRTASKLRVPLSKLYDLVERCMEREYPTGPLGDAIRAEAACNPHTAEWCKCRDAVTTEAMALADAIRAAKGA